MQEASHPQMIKWSVSKNKATQKVYLSEYFTEYMVILAESYTVKGDKFPKNSKKEVKLLDISARTASVKLIADDWIDYLHILKTIDEWKIINVLWQYHDVAQHHSFDEMVSSMLNIISVYKIFLHRTYLLLT